LNVENLPQSNALSKNAQRKYSIDQNSREFVAFEEVNEAIAACNEGQVYYNSRSYFWGDLGGYT
jgi:predicted heme/steroid binding protein